MSRRLRVMESFVAIRDTTNPYQTQLVHSLADSVDVRMFSWRAALLGRFDVLHVHWPEFLLRDRTRIRTAARQILLLLVLLHIRLRRKALVRTLHNIAPHEPGTAVEARLLRLCDRVTTYWIVLNEFTPLPVNARAVLIPHGHYRDWFAMYPAPPSEPGLLLCFGRIRQYKGMPELLGAFRELPDPSLRLRIVGSPDDAATVALVRRAMRVDARITAVLHHVGDAEAATEFGRAELVVLPYPEMHNSGAALLALSLRRRVLVPDNAVTRELARQAGPGWVLSYPNRFDSAALRTGIEQLRATHPASGPDLSGRGWAEIGAAHATAFERAVIAARAGRKPARPE